MHRGGGRSVSRGASRSIQGTSGRSERAARPSRVDRGDVIRDRSSDRRGIARGRHGPRYDKTHVRRHGRRFVWGPGITFWFYDGYYYGECEWLRRRAIATGSSYWWRRYYQCRDW
jgi:hypothetical protein